jgi:hypothetical protein
MLFPLCTVVSGFILILTIFSSREFTVCYRAFDDYGQETYLSLLSDWDLDAAFLR